MGEDIVSTLMKIRERVWATRKKNDGKEINVTLEDALFSAKSMAIMFGNGKVTDVSGTSVIFKTMQFTATTTTEDTATGAPTQWTDPQGKTHDISDASYYDATGVAATSFKQGEIYMMTFPLNVQGGVIEISANTFPGTLLLAA